MLGKGDFFGEGCLAGQSVRMGTATAVTSSTVLVIEKREMFKVLHEQHELSDRYPLHPLPRFDRPWSLQPGKPFPGSGNGK
jgi:CRP/FNR family cyclic AMP-dependent transcriptional regulator